MKILKFSLLLFICFYYSINIKSQEINCKVVIDAKQVQSQEKQVIEKLKESISTFLNTTQWTEDIFSEEERIQCSMLITLGSSSTLTQFQARVQIRSLRPVYGSNYESPVLTLFDDKWSFEYNISQPLIFNENTYSTELTTLLAYYAYTIIAVDYNTFSKEGGKIYYEKMLNILNNTQESLSAGWNAFGDTRDRYWIATHLNDTRFEPFKEAFYIYHRLGMDIMEKDPEKAKKNILKALEKMQETRKLVQISLIINSFFEAKHTELLNIFSKGTPEIKQQAISLLSEMDPIRAGKYKKLVR